MVRKICYVMLIALLASAHLGAAAPDWVTDLTSNIDAMNRNFQAQMQSFTQNLHRQLENSLEQVHKSIENLPKDAQGRIITSNGNAMINSLFINDGISKTVMSGRTQNGEPYIRIVEERRDRNYLYHNETSTNPITNVTESIRWKLDLNTPGAKPEIITE